MYKLFAGSCYYPSGGYRDFVGSYSTLEAAQAAGEEVGAADSYAPGMRLYDWWHVVANDEIVAYGR